MPGFRPRPMALVAASRARKSGWRVVVDDEGDDDDDGVARATRRRSCRSWRSEDRVGPNLGESRRGRPRRGKGRRHGSRVDGVRVDVGADHPMALRGELDREGKTDLAERDYTDVHSRKMLSAEPVR